jgi:hypothetical protein
LERAFAFVWRLEGKIEGQIMMLKWDVSSAVVGKVMALTVGVQVGRIDAVKLVSLIVKP